MNRQIQSQGKTQFTVEFCPKGDDEDGEFVVKAQLGGTTRTFRLEMAYGERDMIDSSPSQELMVRARDMAELLLQQVIRPREDTGKNQEVFNTVRNVTISSKDTKAGRSAEMILRRSSTDEEDSEISDLTVEDNTKFERIFSRSASPLRPESAPPRLITTASHVQRVLDESNIEESLKRGDRFVREYSDLDGNMCGKENAELCEGLSRYKEVLTQRKGQLQAQLISAKGPEKQKLLLEKEFIERRLTLMKEPRESDELISCNYFRDLLSECSKESTEGTEIGYEGCRKALALADERYIPAPINMWRQSFLDPSGKKTTWLRIGAIYDNRSSHFSLSEILNDSGNIDQKKLQELRKKIHSKYDKYRPKGKTPLSDWQLGLTLKNKWKVASLDRALQMLKPENIERTVVERKTILETQFLTLLAQHIREHPDQLSSGQFKMVQLSLLNPEKAKIEKGWSHYESQEMQEMAWLFAQMNGKDISFDLDESQAPHMEGATIHMPKSLNPNGETTVELKSHFINVDVQNMNKSSSRGEKLVDLISKELKEEMEEDDEGRSILRRMKQGVSEYSVAQDVMAWLDGKGYAIGVNCQSAKDRTGIVCDRFVQSKIRGVLQARFSRDAKKAKKELERFDYWPLGQENLAFRVIKRNTGLEGIKCNPVKVTGFINKLRYTVMQIGLKYSGGRV